MNLPSLAGSARNLFFWPSASISRTNPIPQISAPMTAYGVISSSPLSAAIAARAGDEHERTHRPCRFHVMKNRLILGLIVVNLLSKPSRRIRKKRNDESRSAQTMIIRANIYPTKVIFSASAMVKIIAMTYVTPPVRSKNFSV